MIMSLISAMLHVVPLLMIAWAMTYFVGGDVMHSGGTESQRDQFANKVAAKDPKKIVLGVVGIVWLVVMCFVDAFRLIL